MRCYAAERAITPELLVVMSRLRHVERSADVLLALL